MRCDARMARAMYTIFGWMRAHQTPGMPKHLPPFQLGTGRDGDAT
jgi:hypothetical protein